MKTPARSWDKAPSTHTGHGVILADRRHQPLSKHVILSHSTKNQISFGLTHVIHLVVGLESKCCQGMPRLDPREAEPSGEHPRHVLGANAAWSRKRHGKGCPGPAPVTCLSAQWAEPTRGLDPTHRIRSGCESCEPSPSEGWMAGVQACSSTLHFCS